MSKENTKNSAPVLIVFFSIFLAISILVSYSLWQPILLQYKSRNWPAAQAFVKECKMEKVRTTSHSGKGSRRRTIIQYRISYEFEVASASYSGDYVVAKRPENCEGNEIEIYYDPQDPGSSVTEPGLRRKDVVAACISGLFVLVGFTGLKNCIKMLFKKK